METVFHGFVAQDAASGTYVACVMPCNPNIGPPVVTMHDTTDDAEAWLLQARYSMRRMFGAEMTETVHRAA